MSVTTTRPTHPLATREDLPLRGPGIPRDPRDPVPPRPELQLAEGTARWCGHCSQRRIARYENFALRCGACGYATQPLNADDMRELIQVVIKDFSTDELKSGLEGALLKIWAQRTARANDPDQRALPHVSDEPILYPTAPARLLGAATLPAMQQRRPSVAEHFWERVCKTDTCWVWLGDSDCKGFPRFEYRRGKARRAVYAHRFAWELEKGPLERAARLLPTTECTERRCVRPDHHYVTRSYQKRAKQNALPRSPGEVPRLGAR